MRTVLACVSLLMVSIAGAATHPRQSDKPPVTEIYELYCWRAPQSVWQFVMLPNTSREETVAEVFQNPDTMNIEAVRRRLDALRPGARIVVVTALGIPGHLGSAPESEQLRIPPRPILDDLKDAASRRRIAIDAVDPVPRVYELYCWESPEGARQFLVLPRTPRQMTADEIFANPNVVSGVDALRSEIQRLERRAEILVVTAVKSRGGNGRPSGGEVLLPLSRAVLDDLRDSVKTRGIRIKQ